MKKKWELWVTVVSHFTEWIQRYRVVYYQRAGNILCSSFLWQLEKRSLNSFISPLCCLPLYLGLIFPFFHTWENANPGVSGHSRTPQVLQPIFLCPWAPAQGSGCSRPCVPLTAGWVSLGIHPCRLQGCFPAWGKVPSSDLCSTLAKRTFPWAPFSPPPPPVPQRHLPVWSRQSQDWAEWQKSLPFPANSQHHFLSEPAELAFYPAQKVAAWLTQSILSDIPSGSSFLNEAMSLNSDSGDDKLQDSEKKRPPWHNGDDGNCPSSAGEGSSWEMMVFYPLFVKLHGMPTWQMLSIVTAQK